MSAVADPTSMLLAERAGPLLRLTLNRPDRRNALHPAQMDRLAELVTAADGADDVSAITIEGAGGRAFSAGFDIDVLAEHDGSGPPPSAALFAAVETLGACRKPTIAIVRGHCLGAGFDLAMACDFRIAAGEVRFAVPAVRLGTVYEPRSVDRILRLIGPTVTKEIFVMGRTLDGPAALRAGIVQELVSEDGVGAALARWVSEPSAAAEAHKRIVDALVASTDRSPGFWAPLDALRSASVAGGERKEALQRFRERRSASSEGGGA